VFGCLAFASTNSPSHGKLDVWSCKCLFLGYVSGTNSYILYDLNSKETFTSRNVLFYENIFPLQADHALAKDSSPLVPVTKLPLSNDDFLSNDLLPHTNDNPSSTFTDLHESNSGAVIDTSTNINDVQPITRRSIRVSKPPSYLQDYLCQHLKDFHCTLSAVSAHQSSTSVRYPIQHSLPYSSLLPTH
jgi:hypothetical protein